MSAALVQVPSVKVEKLDVGLGRVNKGVAPCDLSFDPVKTNLGDIAMAVGDARLPNRSQEGRAKAFLVVPAPGLTEENARRLGEVLKAVPGVEAPASTADVKNKTIEVKLDDAKGGAKLQAILGALADYTRKREN